MRRPTHTFVLVNVDKILTIIYTWTSQIELSATDGICICPTNATISFIKPYLKLLYYFVINLKHTFSRVLSDGMPRRCIDFICLALLCCVFSNVSSNRLLQKMHKNIDCFCLAFLFCAVSSVHLNGMWHIMCGWKSKVCKGGQLKEARWMWRREERRRLWWAGVCLPIHGSAAAGLIDHITRG